MVTKLNKTEDVSINIKVNNNNLLIQEKSKPLLLSRGCCNKDNIFFPVSKPEKTFQVFLAKKISENFLWNLDKPTPSEIKNSKIKDFGSPRNL